MSQSVDRAARRQERRSGRSKDHQPLLLLAQQDTTRPPTKPRLKPLIPLTDAQRRYDASINVHTLVFGVGPAGTGKTWWAAMRAAEAFKSGEIERIIVTRPAVEAGESLGFLPGELDEKYEPYFRPVRGALEESLGSSHLEYLLKVGRVEARPLALLRGSTLKNAWVIADEMQNATVIQMKLLLTRIGENAKFIVNGDPDQCDLPDPSKSGLVDAMRRLARIKSVGSVEFTEDDVVRSGLCQEIVRAYSTRKPSSPRYVESDINDDSGLRRVLGVNDDGRDPDLWARQGS